MGKKIEIAVNELKSKLKKHLSIYKCYSGNQFVYEVKEMDLKGIYVLFVIPTSKEFSFISMAAIESIRELYQSSDLKEYLCYGAETYTYNDLKTGNEITLPCISIQCNKAIYEE